MGVAATFMAPGGMGSPFPRLPWLVILRFAQDDTSYLQISDPSSPVPFTPGLTGKLIFIYTRTGEGQGLDYFGHHVDKCEKIPLDSGERSKHEKRLRRSEYYF
jgi:hypothetical protein